MDWAEKGLQAFPQADLHLQSFLANVMTSHGRKRNLVALIRKAGLA